MNFYQVELSWINLDNNLYTDAQASLTLEIQASDINHAYLLAEHLRKIYSADSYTVN